MPVQVMDDEGSGTVNDIYNGIIYAVDNGADVINLSFGSYEYSATEEQAISAALDAGIVVVAAVGNDSKNLNQHPMYPACDEGVLGVGSINEQANHSSFTNYGSDCADVYAPGSSILSTLFYDPMYSFDSEYSYMSGTSMATPVVSGIAGLLKSYHADLDNEDINNTLTETLNSDYVDASAALELLDNPPRPKRPAEIKAYTGKKKTHKIKEAKYTAEATPYFKWTKSTTVLGDVTGYYVYWGRRKTTNPAKKGKWQTKNKYLITKAKKIHRSEPTIFYLKVKAKNSYGKISKKSRVFKYYYQP
jgi:subtilisin family serine protease